MNELKNFLDRNGLRYKWFAENVLGISANYLSNVMAGRQAMPLKYWKTIVDFSQGVVTYSDLARHFDDFMAHKK